MWITLGLAKSQTKALANKIGYNGSSRKTNKQAYAAHGIGGFTLLEHRSILIMGRGKTGAWQIQDFKRDTSFTRMKGYFAISFLNTWGGGGGQQCWNVYIGRPYPSRLCYMWEAGHTIRKPHLYLTCFCWCHSVRRRTSNNISWQPSGNPWQRLWICRPWRIGHIEREKLPWGKSLNLLTGLDIDSQNLLPTVILTVIKVAVTVCPIFLDPRAVIGSIFRTNAVTLRIHFWACLHI